MFKTDSRILQDKSGQVYARPVANRSPPTKPPCSPSRTKYQFQWWALGPVGTRPVEQKKGADHGMGDKILFRDDPHAAKPEQIIIQVKGGKASARGPRDWPGVRARQNPPAAAFVNAGLIENWRCTRVRRHKPGRSGALVPQFEPEHFPAFAV